MPHRAARGSTRLVKWQREQGENEGKKHYHGESKVSWLRAGCSDSLGGL